MKKAIELKSGSASLHFKLGKIYVMLDEMGEAKVQHKILKKLSNKAARKLQKIAASHRSGTFDNSMTPNDDSVFSGWYDFAKDKNDQELTKAINCLEYRLPRFLYSYSFRERVKIAVTPENEAGTTKNSKKQPGLKAIKCQRRVLKILRNDAFLDDVKVCEASRYICNLPKEDDRKIFELGQLARKAFRKTQDEVRDYKSKQSLRNITKKILNIPLNQLCEYSSRRLDLGECWRNQKTLAGSIELYGLDKNLKVTELTPEFLKKLRKEGYLKYDKSDPDYGSDSANHYKITPGGDIYCTHHGFLVPPEGCDGNSTIREQLQAYGITDENRLDECADIPPIPNN